MDFGTKADFAVKEKSKHSEEHNCCCAKQELKKGESVLASPNGTFPIIQIILTIEIIERVSGTISNSVVGEIGVIPLIYAFLEFNY